ncbi:ATP-binding protein [Berryella wangjianweii]|uniref:ATP-binding protein n=1 Tax=Berryella wangjianweii TaxID=2734634 RepID=UPI0021BD7BF1|nr:ATP-binding protein [Berryella wangjianweii]
MQGAEGHTWLSRIGFKTKVVGLLALFLVALLVAFSLWTLDSQRQSTEAGILSQSRMLATEMEAVWEFVSVNQRTINYASDGAYEYKGLHCAIAGKSVASLFSRQSDESIRFTSLTPRNASNAPDWFEREALAHFAASSDTEYYGFDTSGDTPRFRYVRAMPVTEHCVECHGGPAGELDPTGAPKEGLAIGEVAGGMSVSIPTEAHFQAMGRSILRNILFFLGIVACLAVAIYAALSKMVSRPLLRLGESLRHVDRNPSDHIQLEPVSALYASRETDDLFERFNAMSDRLTRLYRDLEGQVRDRTNQLASANAQLQEQSCQLAAINERLKRESQYKSDFLAIVSHELRTPLTSILAFTELMEQEVPAGNERVRRQLDEVARNAQTLLEMVSNILETARIQAGSERLNIELVELSDVLGMVEASMRPLAAKRRIDLRVGFGEGVPLLSSDWEKLRRIVSNLVSNAIKFTDPGGWVRVDVGVADEGGTVLIAVSDNGIGIPPDKHSLVFERFTQENMSTVRSYGGSGLGLSLVRDLCRMLGGEVRLESEPGKGSAFTVSLPTAGPPACQVGDGAAKGDGTSFRGSDGG